MYHSTLGLRVIKKEKNDRLGEGACMAAVPRTFHSAGLQGYRSPVDIVVDYQLVFHVPAGTFSSSQAHPLDGMNYMHVTSSNSVILASHSVEVHLTSALCLGT